MNQKKLLVAEHRDLIEILYELARSQLLLAEAIQAIGSDTSMPASVSNYVWDKRKDF